MKICQYEFQFQDEFMERIESGISKLLNISLDNFIKKKFKSEALLLRKDTENNYMLFLAQDRKSVV